MVHCPAYGRDPADISGQCRDTTLASLIQTTKDCFQIPETGLEILDTARQVQRQYASLDLDLDLDLADAVNVGLAAQYRTDAVLTLDRRDFRAIRPLTPHKWFRLLPDDL
jgi:uncharacterized protein